MAATTGTKKSSGHLAGQIQRNSVPQGSYQVFLKGFTSAKWSQTKADVNDSLTMEVGCEGIENGTKANFRIHERSSNNPDIIIYTLDAQVSGKNISAQWKYPKDRWAKAKPPKRPLLPSYFFECVCLGHSIRSGLLQLTTTINVIVLDENNKAVANEPFDLFLSTREIRPATTDGNGKAKFQKIPLGCHQLKFAKSPLIAPDKPTKIESPLEIRKFPLDIFNDNTFYANSVIVKCKHQVNKRFRYVINPPDYSIVQDAPELKGIQKKEEPDEIEIYTRSKTKLTDSNGNAVLQETESGFKKYRIEASHSGNHGSNEFYLPKFWQDMAKPTQYQISGLKNKLAINAYTPDQYKLSISFPTPKLFESGARWMKGKVEQIEDHKIAPHIPGSFRYEKEEEKEQWGKLSYPLAIFSTDRPVNLKVNGSSVEISALDAFGSVILFMKKINSIVDLIRQNLPEAGGYFTFKNEYLKGKCVLKWGWKEYIDHRVYMYYAASIEMTILSVEMEIGVGFSSFGTLGQLYASLKGEVSVGIGLERNSPELPKQITIPFAATIEGTIGARVKVGTIINAELKGVTALEIKEGKIALSTEQPFAIVGTIHWTGIKGKISVSAGVGKSGGEKETDTTSLGKQATAVKKEDDVYVLIKESELGKFKIPSEDKYETSYSPSIQVKRIFTKVFNTGRSISIIKPDKTDYGQSKAIDLIVKHIDERNDLNRSEKSIELVAFAVRKLILDRYIHFGILELESGILSETFKSLCEDGELDSILNGISDPTLEIMHSLKK